MTSQGRCKRRLQLNIKTGWIFGPETKYMERERDEKVGMWKACCWMYKKMTWNRMKIFCSAVGGRWVLTGFCIIRILFHVISYINIYIHIMYVYPHTHTSSCFTWLEALRYRSKITNEDRLLTMQKKRIVKQPFINSKHEGTSTIF